MLDMLTHFLRFILVYFGVFWCIFLVFFGIFWYILVYFCIFWYILVYFGIFLCNILVYFGIFLYIFVYFGVALQCCPNSFMFLWYVAPPPLIDELGVVGLSNDVFMASVGAA